MKTALITPEGAICVEDRAAPETRRKSARVRVTRSLISTGTETDVIRSRRKRPADAELFPGYSAAGEIVELSGDGGKGQIGRRVACAGWAWATHSEQIVVPQNLFAPIPDGVDDDNAAFIGCAITGMHALRQGGVAGGDSVVVVGMGLFGQIVSRIADAFGAVVYGVAKHPHQAELARSVCREVYDPAAMDERFLADVARNTPVDAAVITAGGDQSEMIQAAGSMLRDRGTVVILGRGWASIDFREKMFAKELTLKNTRAYGPGRYDPLYEREGIDYPVGYVRWTENRNMLAVLELMARGRLDLRPLISRRCPLVELPAAYEKLLSRGHREIAILVEYA